jgi:hypothetical protein
MKKILSTLLISATVLTVSGCASMFGDNTRTVNINSNPSGADVYINGVNRGSTPLALNLPTHFDGGASITLKKSGYKDTGIFIDAKFQLVGLWNVLTFPIGFMIDQETGYFLKVDPDALNTVVNLSKSS